MFRIKICGITNVEDALMAAEAGAEAIGLNFFSGSKRFVGVNAAEAIADALPAGISKVGVFVNEEPDEIEAIARRVKLDFVQLHGKEPPDYLLRLPRQLPVIRAFRCGTSGFTPLQSYMDECESIGATLAAVLADADMAGEYGGTGRLADWTIIADERRQLRIPLLLAGGLTPENVSEAVALVRPKGVDVASGVEAEPGRKDASLVRRFIDSARDALARL
jgi:phosphoribosylanthranilate isomerase